MGTKDGSIIATIITTHMPRYDAAAPGHVCPGIRIHAIDIVQPPGIGISPIADMDAHQTIVTAALAAKSSAETPKKARWEARSEAMGREISGPAVAPRQPRLRSALVVLVVAAPKLLLIQIVFFQEFGPEILWRSTNVWPTVWRKVHEIPIRPHRIDMIGRKFSSPEMNNLSTLPPKYMHHWPLHIIRVSLAFVIGLIRRVGSGNQRNLRPSTLFGPRIDSIGRGFGNCDKRGILSDLIPGSIKPIDQRRTGRTGIVPARTVHE